MRSLLMGTLLVAVFVARDARACDEAGTSTVGLLAVQEVFTLSMRGAASLFDANSRDQWAKGHLPGARWVDFHALAERDLPRSKDRLLVFYCYNKMCLASHEAAQRALAFGYTNVFVMPDGIQGWTKAGKPVEKGGGEG